MQYPRRYRSDRLQEGEQTRQRKSLSHVRSSNRGLICLPLSSKLFAVDVTLCVDTPPNSGVCTDFGTEQQEQLTVSIIMCHYSTHSSVLQQIVSEKALLGINNDIVIDICESTTRDVPYPNFKFLVKFYHSSSLI